MMEYEDYFCLQKDLEFEINCTTEEKPNEGDQGAGRQINSLEPGERIQGRNGIRQRLE
jgi:hypothetical protein